MIELYELIENFEGEVDQAVLFGDYAWMQELVNASDDVYEAVDFELGGEGEDFRNRIANCLMKLEEAMEWAA
jgi:hypothetical protein